MQPYCRIRNVVEAGIAERQTAALYLRKLAAGVLDDEKVWRDTLFIYPRLMPPLTAEEPDLSYRSSSS